MRAVTRTLWVCLLIAALQSPVRAVFPQPTGYVNDFSNLLSDSVRSELEQLLRDTEKQTTAEVVLAIVPSLDGMPVEEYANRLFKEWGIGKETIDNGVLVLVAPHEREMRIEVGYGLEPVLPDGLSGEIIRTNFLPRFREEDYPGGIRSGVARVVEIVRRNHVLTADERRALEEAADDRPPVWLMISFFGLFISIGFFMVGLGIGSKTGFPLIFGSLFGGMPFLMALIPFFNASVLVLGPLALGMAVVGYRKGRRLPSWVQQMRNASGKSDPSQGWVLGANSDSSSSDDSHSSSDSSSSSSDFGGGSSGGGGASGRW